MKRTIVVLEDDGFKRAEIAQRLKSFPLTELKEYSTESELRDALRSLHQGNVAVFILDLRVRWDKPREGMTQPPPDIGLDGYREAGIRCWRLIRQDPRLAKARVIIYSVADEFPPLDGPEEPPVFIQKNDSLKRLLDEVYRAMKA